MDGWIFKSYFLSKLNINFYARHHIGISERVSVHFMENVQRCRFYFIFIFLVFNVDNDDTQSELAAEEF